MKIAKSVSRSDPFLKGLSALLLPLMLTACGSLEFALPSLSTKQETQPVTTSSITPDSTRLPEVKTPQIHSLITSQPNDISQTLSAQSHITKAINRALGETETAQTVTWINPENGAFGIITPIGDKIASDNESCQAIIISQAAKDAQKYFQAMACQSAQEQQWHLRSLKPMDKLS